LNSYIWKVVFETEQSFSEVSQWSLNNLIECIDILDYRAKVQELKEKEQEQK